MAFVLQWEKEGLFCKWWGKIKTEMFFIFYSKIDSQVIEELNVDIAIVKN